MNKPIKKQVWNNVDAIGLLNGISIWDEQYQKLKYVRLPDESNIELRHKINNFRTNPIEGNIDQQLMRGLANELNLNSYDNNNVSTFVLSRSPFPIEDKRIQDVFVYYQVPNSDIWEELTPQYWSEDVEFNTPTNGFIVWENMYYNNSTENSKTNTYSRLLQVYEDLPHNTRLKITYTIRRFDENDNPYYLKFTDISNKEDPDDVRFIYKKGDTALISELIDHVCVYSLSKIPENFRDRYFESDGKPKDLLFEIQDVIDDVYKTRWKYIKNRNTIWDINTTFASGVIPSFYDIGSDSISTFTDSLIGGVNYYNTALYLKDIDIMYDEVEDIEHWYPVLQPGPFYLHGKKQYLMQNPKHELINFTNNKAPLPSGVKITHYTILNKNTAVINSGYIYNDYDYKITCDDGDYIPNDNIIRKRPHLTLDKGFEIILDNNEYMIDYDDRIIYSKGITSAMLYWDEVDIPDKVTIVDKFVDMNPINDTELSYDSYFITITE